MCIYSLIKGHLLVPAEYTIGTLCGTNILESTCNVAASTVAAVPVAFFFHSSMVIIISLGVFSVSAVQVTKRLSYVYRFSVCLHEK